MKEKIKNLYGKLNKLKNTINTKVLYGIGIGLISISFICVVFIIINVTEAKKDGVPMNGIVIDKTTTNEEEQTLILQADNEETKIIITDKETTIEKTTNKDELEETTNNNEDKNSYLSSNNANNNYNSSNNNSNNNPNNNNNNNSNNNPNNNNNNNSNNNPNNNNNNNSNNNPNNNNNNNNNNINKTETSTSITNGFVGHDNPYWTLSIPALPQKGGWADLNTSYYTSLILDGLNAHRADFGNPNTTTNSYLNELAQYQARYMATKEECFHAPDEIRRWNESCSADLSSPYFYKKYPQYQDEADNPYFAGFDYGYFFNGDMITSPLCMDCYSDELHGQGYVLGRHCQVLSTTKNMIVGIGIAMDYKGNVYICINGVEKEDITYTVEEDEGVVRYPFMEDVERARQFYTTVKCR